MHAMTSIFCSTSMIALRKDQSMRTTTWVLIAACFVGAAASANGQAVISSTDGVNTVYLGINAEGHLNTDVGSVATNSTRTGLAYQSAATDAIGASLIPARAPGPLDSTSPGCFCEGWGVSTSSLGGRSGYANVSTDGGAVNLTVLASPAPTASSLTSNTRLTNTAGLTVSQAYSVAVPGVLFENTVTIRNTTGGTLNDVKYVRVMDWDVPFNEFQEVVTIFGSGTTTALEYSNNQGFASANPLAADPGSINGAPVGGSLINGDFTDLGPADHGAYFRFNFGSLADGEEVTFSIFYGAAGTEADMLAALFAAQVELYSLGQSSITAGPTFPPFPGDPTLGTPITYAFGFRGVGGVVIPGDVPEPATVAVWSGLVGLAGVMAWRKRR
jgi:hypothetical protein